MKELKGILGAWKLVVKVRPDTPVEAVDILDVYEHIEALHREIDVMRATAQPVQGIGSTDEQLQRRADYNKEHAGELFPQLGWNPFLERWCTDEGLGLPVVFTPYGYLLG